MISKLIIVLRLRNKLKLNSNATNFKISKIVKKETIHFRVQRQTSKLCRNLRLRKRHCNFITVIVQQLGLLIEYRLRVLKLVALNLHKKRILRILRKKMTSVKASLIFYWKARISEVSKIVNKFVHYVLLKPADILKYLNEYSQCQRIDFTIR